MANGSGGSGNAEHFHKLSRIMTYLMVAALVVAIVAAGTGYIAIPRFAQAFARGKEDDGATILRRLLDLQLTYYQQHQAYTANLDDLRPLGWEDPDPRWYTIHVSDARYNRLCLEAHPSPREGEGIPLHTLSMNGDGFLFHRAGCTGEVDIRGSRPLDVS